MGLVRTAVEMNLQMRSRRLKGRAVAEEAKCQVSPTAKPQMRSLKGVASRTASPKVKLLMRSLKGEVAQ